MNICTCACIARTYTHTHTEPPQTPPHPPPRTHAHTRTHTRTHRQLKQEIVSKPASAPGSLCTLSVNQLKNEIVPAPVMTMQSAHAPALPAGWEQKMSASKGEAYYVHTETGRTTWVHPGKEGARRRNMAMASVEAVAKGHHDTIGDPEMSAEVAADVAALAEVAASPFANASENQAKVQKPCAAVVQEGYSAANLNQLDIDITRLKTGLMSLARQKLLLAHTIVLMLSIL